MANKIHRYIFFINKNMVSVFSDEFKPVTNCGEIEFELKDNFWNWWKEAVACLSDDIIDFCFIYDEKPSVLEDEFLKNSIKAKQSFWNKECLKNFIEKNSGLYNIKLIDINNNVLILNKSRLASKSEENVLYTNIEFNKAKIITNDKQENIEIEEVELTPMAKYYTKTLREERLR